MLIKEGVQGLQASAFYILTVSIRNKPKFKRKLRVKYKTDINAELNLKL